MRVFSAAAFILAFTVAGADVIGQAPAGQGGTPAQGQGRAAGAAAGGRGGQGRGGQGRGRGQQGPPPAATPRWPDGKPIMGSIPGKPVDG